MIAVAPPSNRSSNSMGSPCPHWHRRDSAVIPPWFRGSTAKKNTSGKLWKTTLTVVVILTKNRSGTAPPVWRGYKRRRTGSGSALEACSRRCAIQIHAFFNKFIGDDTKATARRSPNYIKKTKKNKILRKTIFNMANGILTPRNVARLWHWFRQMTAPCNVARGTQIEFARWQHLQCGK